MIIELGKVSEETQNIIPSPVSFDESTYSYPG
jgi:hypothetical protein